jgi:hypothetical protein
MDKQTAIKILNDSIVDLERRRGEIFIADIEAEVINNTCLAFLKHSKEAAKNSRTLEGMFSEILKTYSDYPNYIKIFTEAAMELFPEHYKENHAIIHSFSIQQNLAWDGMWDYLRDYFKKNHGIEIDEIKSTETVLYSTRHQRFEDDVLTSESEVGRTINVHLFDDRKEILVSIEPTLSPKKGYLVAQFGKELQYKGTDPDYFFRVFFDEFNEIEQFILELPNRKLRLIYFE